MYTQVTFGLFLERVLDEIRQDFGIEFDEYPNTAVHWLEGQWLYSMDGFSVEIFQWLSHEKRTIKGWHWRDDRDAFEARFASEFRGAIQELSAKKESVRLDTAL